MKKLIIFLTILLSNILNLSAQKITNAGDLKEFYLKYLTYSIKVSDERKQDSLVTVYSTQELYKAWNEDYNEIGLYDPFTNGVGENIDLMKRTLAVKRENNHYVVSFGCLTWPENKFVLENVVVYVNPEGKISHTVRPIDGYMTPSK